MRLDQVSGTGLTGMAPPRTDERRAYPRKAVRLLGWKTTVLLGGEQSEGRLAVIECEGVRGDATPLHLHDNEDEVLCVLEGELTVLLGGGELSAPANAAVVLPRGVEHSFVVESERARVLIVFSPAGFEGLLEEMGRAAGGEGHEIERLVGVAARYGVDFTGPPPKRRRADE
jgi:quercetin dioxygenase-like cupin family protein